MCYLSYLQRNYNYIVCDPGMVSQSAKKTIVPQKVA